MRLAYSVLACESQLTETKMPSLEQLLLDYETRLTDPEVRRSEAAAEFIADDFTESATAIPSISPTLWP
jgi:hypothetical protein